MSAKTKKRETLKQKQLSEKEIKLRKGFKRLQELAKKYRVKPFNRKDVYGTY